MTVNELIEELKKHDGNILVLSNTDYDELHDIRVAKVNVSMSDLEYFDGIEYATYQVDEESKLEAIYIITE